MQVSLVAATLAQSKPAVSTNNASPPPVLSTIFPKSTRSLCRNLESKPQGRAPSLTETNAVSLPRQTPCPYVRRSRSKQSNSTEVDPREKDREPNRQGFRRMAKKTIPLSPFLMTLSQAFCAQFAPLSVSHINNDRKQVLSGAQGRHGILEMARAFGAAGAFVAEFGGARLPRPFSVPSHQCPSTDQVCQSSPSMQPHDPGPPSNGFIWRLLAPGRISREVCF